MYSVGHTDEILELTNTEIDQIIEVLKSLSIHAENYFQHQKGGNDGFLYDGESWTYQETVSGREVENYAYVAIIESEDSLVVFCPHRVMVTLYSFDKALAPKWPALTGELSVLKERLGWGHNEWFNNIELTYLDEEQATILREHVIAEAVLRFINSPDV
jgi:hypothetical protein